MHARSLKFSAFRAIEHTLDRPGGRLLLGALGRARRGVHSALVSAHIWRARRVWVPIRSAARGATAREELARDLFFQQYTPRPGDTVLDVGAGAGEEAELLSRLVGPAGRVYAVEAHPATFAALESRCRAARLENVVPVHAAVSDRVGTVSFSDGASYRENRIVADPGGLAVPALTLDELVDRWALDQIDFVKLNIEGAEEAALRGLARHAVRVRHLTVSCHDFLADRGGAPSNRTNAAVRRLLWGYGFTVTGRGRGDRRHWTRPYLYGARSSIST